MTPALTPALALGYLRELSADVRAGVVLGEALEALAGPPALAAPAAAYARAMGAAAEAETRTPDGAVLAARAPGLAVVLVCGPHVLGTLARHDLRRALADLGAPDAGPPHTGWAAPASPAAALAQALISAAQRDSGS